jgi:hypothetical protein
MKKTDRPYILAILLFSIFTLTACGLMDLYSDIIDRDQQTVEEQVQGTLTAVAAEKDLESTKTAAAEPSPSATIDAPTATTPTKGTITGNIAYPSEFLPPQRVVAFDTQDFDSYYVTEVQSGSTFSLEVPPGDYYVLAYVINPSQVGTPPDYHAAYSQAVLCGLQAGCDDHSLVSVEVKAGESVTDIDPIDWYLPPGEDAGWPEDPLKSGTGSIRGELGYPSEYIPPLRVVAFNVYSENYYYVDTQLNQDTYEITGIPAGTYHVLAYVREEGPGISAGYSQAVPCGLSVDCNDHSLIDVMVYPGEVAEDVDPIDYYAQPEEVNWPEDPTQ